MMADTAVRWAKARRILCVRLDALGDVLMCTPAMRALKEAVPGRSLTLLTSAAGAAAAPFIPEIDDAIVHAAPWMKLEQPAGPDELCALAAALAARRFDAAVVFTTYTQSALPAAMLCWLAGIPLRLAHCRENPYHLLTDWIEDLEPHTLVRHEVQRQLALVRHAGAASSSGSKLSLSFAPSVPGCCCTRVRAPPRAATRPPTGRGRSACWCGKRACRRCSPAVPRKARWSTPSSPAAGCRRIRSRGS